jgi:hypothetical protein
MQHQPGELVGERRLDAVLEQPPFKSVSEFRPPEKAQLQGPDIAVDSCQERENGLAPVRGVSLPPQRRRTRRRRYELFRQGSAGIRGNPGIESIEPHGAGF